MDKFPIDTKVMTYDGHGTGVVVKTDPDCHFTHYIKLDSTGVHRWYNGDELTLALTVPQPEAVPKPEPAAPQPIATADLLCMTALRAVIKHEVSKAVGELVREAVEQRLEELEPVTKAELNELVDERINQELDDEFDNKFDSKIEDWVEDSDIITEDNLREAIRNELRYNLSLTVNVD